MDNNEELIQTEETTSDVAAETAEVTEGEAQTATEPTAEPQEEAAAASESAEKTAESPTKKSFFGRLLSFFKSKKGKKILMYIGIALAVLTIVIVAAVILDSGVVKLVNSDEEAGIVKGGGRKPSGSKTTIHAVANPGYAFTAWTNADGSVASTEADLAVIVPEAKVELTANWTLTNQQIILHLNSDSNTTLYDNTTFTIKSEDIFLDPPTRDEHTFLGWYKDAALTEPADDYIPAGTTENVELYAKWAFSYNITYLITDEGASNNPENPATYTEFADVDLKNPIWYEIKDGTLTGGSYHFDGWYDADGNRIEKIVASNKKDVTLTARFTNVIEYYTVYEKEGVTYVDFGRYPQAVLENPRTVNELKTAIANGTLTPDPLTGLYSYKNTLYAKATAAPYQNEAKNYFGKYSDGEEIVAEKEYFFIVEPITWKVLCGNPKDPNSEVTLLSEKVLTASLFRKDLAVRTSKDGAPIYANNWEYSDVRAFLNGTTAGCFLSEAFMSGEQSFILTTDVDYSKKTGHYPRFANDEASCVDKIFLLSAVDMENTDYGWAKTVKEDVTKMAKATDYAKALGIYASLNKGEEYDSANWWLRSAGDYKGKAAVTTAVGTVATFEAENAFIGVRPALKIKLK